MTHGPVIWWGEHPDEGCDLAPSCLSCPLPVCRYDAPPKVAGAWMREQRLQELLNAGHSADEAAAILGVSRRTVFRLKRQLATERMNDSSPGAGGAR